MVPDANIDNLKSDRVDERLARIVHTARLVVWSVCTKTHGLTAISVYLVLVAFAIRAAEPVGQAV